MLKTENKPQTDWLADWPAHYHEIPTPQEREQVLQTRLEKADDPADRRRLELLYQRYGHDDKHIDMFMHGWLMLTVMSHDRITAFNRRRYEKEFRRNLTELAIQEDTVPDDLLKEEWHDFARLMINICASDKNYRSTLFGLFKNSDETTALHIAQDIDLVTRIIPAQFDLEEACRPFREVLVHTYITEIDQGQTYWDNYCSRRK